jgi:hypothetical protein
MNDLWRQIERWALGESLSDLPAGIETSIEHTWPFAPWLMLLLVIGSALLVVGVYLRERGNLGHWGRILLTSLRLGIVGVLLLMLYGWMIERHRTDLPDIVVMLDDSESMGLADHYDSSQDHSELARRLAALKLGDPTRLNLARLLLLENDASLVTQLSQRYNLKFYLMGSSARQQSDDVKELGASLAQLSATQPSSRLGNCLRDVLEAQRGRPTAAIVLLTDGITTEGKPLSDAAQYARRKAIPLFLIGLGNDKPPRDLAVGDLLVDDVAFVNDLLNFDFTLTSAGFAGSATVRLKRQGESAPLAQQRVTLPAGGGTQSLRLAHRPDKKGEFEYIIEVDPREGEANLQNNSISRKVTVSEETIRVLLVQAYPSYEFRFLKTMLERELNKTEPAHGGERGFRTVLQEADLEYAATDKSAERVFPVSREELFKYDVLILGDMNPSFLSASVMNNIYEFVTVRGGGVVFIAGPKYMPTDFRGTPLEPLLPMDLDTTIVPDPDAVIKDSFRPRLTPLGQTSPQMQLADSPADNIRLWQEKLTPLRWYIACPDLRPGVRVLAEHPTATAGGRGLPIITLQFIGAGKVVFQMTDETYRWRFRVGDLYFARYWIQTIRYLSRSRLLGQSRAAELTTDRTEYRRGDPVRLRVRFFDDRLAPAQDDGVAVVLEQEGSQRKHLVLHRDATNRGIFAGTAGNLRDGKYRVWLATPTVEGPPPAQNFTITAPPGELARTQMDIADLKLAAKTSAGRFYTLATAGNLLDDLPRGRQVRIESLPPMPLWNSPLLASLFVALLGSEWLLRKRYGLL